MPQHIPHIPFDRMGQVPQAIAVRRKTPRLPGPLQPPAGRRLVLLVIVLFLGSSAASPWVLARIATGGTSSTSITVAVGHNPAAVVVDTRTHRAFVLNGGYGNPSHGTVSVIDTNTKTVLQTVAVEEEPATLAIDELTRRVFVLNTIVDEGRRREGSVSVLDSQTGQVLRTVQVGVSPYAVAVNEQANRVYVLNANDGGISVLNGSSGQILRTLHGASNGAPIAGPNVLTLDRRRKRLFAIIGLEVDLFDTGNGQLIRRLHMGRLPTVMLGCVVADERSGHTFVATTKSLTMLDTSTGQMIHEVKGLNYALVDSRHERVAASGRGHVSVLDAHTGRTISTINISGFDGYPNLVSVDEQRGHVFILDRGPLDHAYREIGDGHVSVLDVQLASLLRTIPVGHLPLAVAMDNTTGTIFVANSHSDTVSVLPATR